MTKVPILNCFKRTSTTLLPTCTLKVVLQLEANLRSYRNNVYIHNAMMNSKIEHHVTLCRIASQHRIVNEQVSMGRQSQAKAGKAGKGMQSQAGR